MVRLLPVLPALLAHILVEPVPVRGRGAPPVLPLANPRLRYKAPVVVLPDLVVVSVRVPVVLMLPFEPELFNLRVQLPEAELAEVVAPRPRPGRGAFVLLITPPGGLPRPPCVELGEPKVL